MGELGGFRASASSNETGRPARPALLESTTGSHPMHALRHIVFAAVAALAAAAPAFAADLTVDDFTTGPYRSPQFKSGWDIHAPEQSGAMLGNYRDTYLLFCDPNLKGDCASRNPYNVTVSYLIGPTKDKTRSAFMQNAGYETPPRLEIHYGEGPGGMSKDLSGGPDRRLRFTFESLSQPLNFNVLLYTGSGRGIDGCNVMEINHSFVLELPLSEFSMANGGFDPSQITFMDVIFQSSSVIGSVEFGLSKIEVVDEAMGGAIHCGPIQ
jgi:hypothetical protein